MIFFLLFCRCYFWPGLLRFLGLKRLFPSLPGKISYAGRYALLLGFVDAFWSHLCLLCEQPSSVQVFLVLFGWPVFGMLLEIFGIINRFGNFFPLIIEFMKRFPIIGLAFFAVQLTYPARIRCFYLSGPVLNNKYVASLTDRLTGAALPSSNSRSHY